MNFLKHEVKFLGYTVLKEGVTIPGDRKEAFRTMTVPTTHKGMQKVLGAFNYFRDFVPGYVEITRPLTRLAAASSGLITLVERDAFDALREALLCVAYADGLRPKLAGCPFILEVDASGYAVGAVLLQDQQST